MVRARHHHLTLKNETFAGLNQFDLKSDYLTEMKIHYFKIQKFSYKLTQNECHHQWHLINNLVRYLSFEACVRTPNQAEMVSEDL